MVLGCRHFLMPVFDDGDETARYYEALVNDIRDFVFSKEKCDLLYIGLSPFRDENDDNDQIFTLRVKLVFGCFLQLLACESKSSSKSRTTFELRMKNEKPIYPGSTLLGFTDDYQSLETICGVIRENIPLNHKSLFDAVCSLTSSDFPDNKTIARSLIILKQMFMEAVTVPCIQDFIAGNFLKSDSFPPPHMLELESKRQHELQKLTVRRPTGRLVDLHKGMLANHYMPTCQRRVVEVLSVSMRLKKPGRIYGAVYDQDGFLMYSRKGEDAEYISGSQQLLLERSELIKPTDFVAFVLYLTDTISQSVIINDCFGYIPTNICDGPLVKTCAGSSGSVTLAYVVMSNSNAAQASVEVKLIAGEGEAGNPAEVCGELFAGFGGRAYGRHEITLFRRRKDLDEYAEAKPGDQIMLSRSVVALPFDSEHLIVRANLHHRNSAGEIAKGIAKFPPNNSGTYKEKIFGKHGQILVTVNWLNTTSIVQ